MTPAPRVLPHNLEAERAVLGAVMINNASFHGAAALITSKHFYRDAHRRIFQAQWNLADKNAEIDIITVRDELERAGDLEECGGAAYVASLVDGVPHAYSCASYAEIVKDKATLRALIYNGNDIVSQAYEAERPATEVVTWAEQKLFDLANGHLESRLQDLRSSGRSLLADLEFREKNRGKVTGVETGFHSFNELTHGWEPGDLIFVGARPSIGKTTLVVNSAIAASRAGHVGAIFSMEMRRKQLEYRILSQLSEVPLKRMKGGALGGSDHEKVAAAMEIMHDLPFYIDDTPARSIWDIRSACRQLKAERGLGYVVVDYVQLMRGTLELKQFNRNAELTDISNRFKTLAGELNVPIIVLSQLRRANPDRPDPRPKMSDLKDCGAFEQDADVVVLLHRKHHREGGVTNAIFEKMRNGDGGTVNITLDRDIVTFTDGGAEEPTPPATTAPVKPRRRRSSLAY
ncbi:MAG: replicative DNA helicase [Betaproteobacteria bacterium]|nr:replicative DNA helicase [Betaproteobacteria bacterium]